MKLESFEFITKSEYTALLFFKKTRLKDGPVFCTRCRSVKIYQIIGQIIGTRYRCKFTFILSDYSIKDKLKWISEISALVF